MSTHLSKSEIQRPNAERKTRSEDQRPKHHLTQPIHSDFGLRISSFPWPTYVRLLLCACLAACLGPFVALPTMAASLQLVTNDWGTHGMPTNVVMYIYVPNNLATNPPILVLLHYWGGGASGVFAEAQGGGIVAAADQYGFIMVVPQTPDCWDVNSTATLTHDGGGQTEAIAHMVNYTVTNYHANSNRVYVTGTSCGAMMTEALLAVYPDIFKAGASFSGQVVGGAWTPITHTAQQWGDIARACYPGYSGPRPRVQLWHGTADTIINYTNQLEAIAQWGNVLGLSTNPASSNMLTILSITNQWIHQSWQDPCGDTVLDAWSEINGPHGTDANLNARYVIPFLGLDQVGPTDPVPTCTVVSAYSQVEAETYNSKSAGIQIESCSEGGKDITGIQNGSYVAYKHVDFGGGAASFQARVASGASGGNIELHLDSLAGVLIGTCVVTNSGGWQTWTTQTRPVGGALGMHDLYLKFTGGTGNLFSINWWWFTSAAGVDIGAVGLSGGATSSNGVYTVAGAGADIQSTADAFHFVYVPASGDCTIIARVASVPNVNSWAKAGVMIRESLDPGAANAFVAVTPANGVTWQCRTNTGGTTTYNNNGSLNAPYWVKLVRSGSTFATYRSPDGSAWTQQGSTNFTMASTAYIGLAVTSHTTSGLCAATFDNVSAPAWLPAIPPAPTGLVATASSSIQIKLIWNACANATGYNLKRSAISGGPYTTINTGIANTNYTDSVASVSTGWYYVVSAVVAGSETPNSAEAAPRFLKLTGAIIGTSGTYSGGNTISNVFDNNLSTFFDGPTGNGCWAGLDFGAGVSNVITKINYCPRSGFESRMVNGIFQGANRADFSDAVALYTVGTQPAAGGFTSVSISNTAAFRYVRYLSPNNGYGNVSEVEFYGYQFALPTPVPTGLSAVAVSPSQINLTWNALANATGYNIKRSTTNGGPYAVIATGLTATNYQDNGLAGGTIYYYVVSAVLAGNETPNSAQAWVATVSPSLGSLVHRYRFLETGGAIIADSVGGPVWNGSLPSGGTFSGGQLTLASNLSQYVLLPAGIISTMSNFTIEVWAQLSSVDNGVRLFDFGNSASNCMFLTPRNSSTAKLRFGVVNLGNFEQDIDASSALSMGVWNHVVVTLNGNSGIAYLNGTPVGTNSYVTNFPFGMGITTNNWLGRSELSTTTYLDGVLDEFRIYNATLSPGEIAATYAMGPDRVLSTNSPSINLVATDTNLTLNWPVESAGFTLQWRTNLVLGDWMNVVAPATQIVGSQWQTTLPQPGDANPAFYRLVK